MRNFVVLRRSRKLINTDPQRRCYNGCHAKSELVWSKWEALEYCPTVEKAEERIKFWESLNEIAVEGRGESAKRQFRIETTVKKKTINYIVSTKGWSGKKVTECETEDVFEALQARTAKQCTCNA